MVKNVNKCLPAIAHFSVPFHSKIPNNYLYNSPGNTQAWNFLQLSDTLQNLLQSVFQAHHTSELFSSKFTGFLCVAKEEYLLVLILFNLVTTFDSPTDPWTTRALSSWVHLYTDFFQ